jgi:hypothetical protein
MPYTVTGDTVGLAVGPLAETAYDVHEALNKARQMYETGMVNVAIKDEAGREIGGDELLDCLIGKRKITSDLQAETPSSLPNPAVWAWDCRAAVVRSSSRMGTDVGGQ